MASRMKQPQGRGISSIFSCCFKGSEQPEITYCHDNPNNATVLEPTLPMPPLPELDSLFTELVDELDLTAENRAAMFSLPAEKKWQIYCGKKLRLKRDRGDPSEEPLRGYGGSKDIITVLLGERRES
ncbi:disheveled-associated activator of morphogenesis 1-like [Notothenia coriiceps]|uniref:Disheveled-associated activator of morphogenesis 1-like n=1 Tax=Notothenia coriiceps TaxID=8208 RepID=A0A6I9Q527_9TELE|nr:PREDICTED: disheveled-associated activator of morphogenesis 1-like [Notothenia coriiceps]